MTNIASIQADWNLNHRSNLVRTEKNFRKLIFLQIFFHVTHFKLKVESKTNSNYDNFDRLVSIKRIYKLLRKCLVSSNINFNDIKIAKNMKNKVNRKIQREVKLERQFLSHFSLKLIFFSRVDLTSEISWISVLLNCTDVTFSSNLRKIWLSFKHHLSLGSFKKGVLVKY